MNLQSVNMIHTKAILLLSIIFLSGLSNTLYSQHHKTDTIDPVIRAQWIMETVSTLQNLDLSAIEKKIVLKTRDHNGEIHQSYRIIKNGLIEFGKNQWVYIVLQSSHNNEKIGDIAIGRDKKGNFFVHYGHICGMIAHYEAVAPEIYTKSIDFFKYFKDDTGGLSWQKLKLKN